MNSLKLSASLLVVAVCLTGNTFGFGFRQAVLVECETEDAYIVHEDCTKYYQCSNFEPYLLECDGGLFFNPIAVSCDFPENVPECIGGTRDPGYEVSNPPNPTTPAPEVTTPAPNPEVTTPAPEVTTPAPEVTTPAPELTTESSGEITCPAEGIEYLPDPTNCQNYYLCADGEAIPQTCADGLLFDPETKKCRVAEEVTCGSNPNPTTGNPDPEPTTGNPDPEPTTGNPDPEPTTGNPEPEPTTDGPLPAECPSSGEIYLPVDGDCTKYIWCVEGTAYPMECGVGTEFSPEEQSCVLESEYECPFPRVKVFRGVLSNRH